MGIRSRSKACGSTWTTGASLRGSGRQRPSAAVSAQFHAQDSNRRAGVAEQPACHRISFEARPFGKLKLKVEGTGESCGGWHGARPHPRDDCDDYSPEIIARRRALVQEASGIALRHIVQCSLTHITKGNCENFLGVAQVPIGLAGPLLIHGEHAAG